MRLFLAILLIFSLPLSSASITTLKSGPNQVPLIELFTSQGCSSCPPAEKWLSRLKDDSGLWTSFVPVAFHVDYWDYLGWKDPFSSAQYTDRQRRYSALWGAQTIYTPGFVLNGNQWREWGGKIRFGEQAALSTGKLEVKIVDRRKFEIHFSPLNPESEYQVSLAVLGMGMNTAIQAGENRGRSLAQDFVVLELSERPLNKKQSDFTAQFAIDNKLNAFGGTSAVAVWISKSGNPTPIQAVGGYF